MTAEVDGILPDFKVQSRITGKTVNSVNSLHFPQTKLTAFFEIMHSYCHVLKQSVITTKLTHCVTSFSEYTVSSKLMESCLSTVPMKILHFIL
jgi:hypothetical protein